MRLAWIVPGPLDQRTGGYLYDRLMVERLRANGDEVHVVVTANENQGVTLARRVAALRTDAVVGDALAADALGELFARLEGSSARVLLVHHLTSWEGEALQRDTRRREEAQAIAASDALIATSSRTAARLANEHGRVADVVVPGADRLQQRSLAAARTTPHERVAFLFVGSLVPRKRLPLLLEAMDRLAPRDAELRIAGDPERDADHARSIEALVARSPYLSSHVKLCGAIDDEALVDELSRADALILPSSLEGYGMVLTEALRAGVPVIATSSWAPPELATTPDVALLFDDERDLIANLRRFVRDPSLRARMRAAAQAHAPSLPTWDGASIGFRSALRRAATKAGRAPLPERSA